MRTLLLLAMLAPSLFGVTIWLPNDSYCDVTNATNATPIRITVSDITQCNITANGQKVFTSEIRGNTAANVHVENSSDTDHLVFTVSGLSGNSFDLLTDTGSNTVGNVHASCSGAVSTHAGPCTFRLDGSSASGRVSRATQYTLNDHPRLFLDGPSGTRTAALNDNTKKETSSNPPYTVVTGSGATFAGAYGSQWGANWRLNEQSRGHMALDAALSWWMDNSKTGELAAAKFMLQYPDQMLGTPACLDDGGNSGQKCGNSVETQQPVNNIIAFPLYAGTMNTMMNYSLVQAQLSSGERTNFNDWYLSDNAWTQAGVNYTAASSLNRAAVRAKTSGCTVSTTSGSATLTGSGSCSWSSQITVGDILILPEASGSTSIESYGRVAKITAVNSNTSLTMSYNALWSISGSNYLIGQAWDNTLKGFLFHQNIFEYTPTNGSGDQLSTSEGRISSLYYNTYSGFYREPRHNHTVNRVVAKFGAGLALADDPRGRLLAAINYEYILHRIVPFALQQWTGFSGAGNSYHQENYTGPVMMAAVWLKNSVISAPDLLPSTFIDKFGKWILGAFPPQTGNVLGVNEGGENPTNGSQTYTPLAAMALQPSSTISQFVRWFLVNTNYHSNGGAYGTSAVETYLSSLNLLLYDPTVTATQPTSTSLFFIDRDISDCTTRFGASRCSEVEDVARMAVSYSAQPTGTTKTMTYLANTMYGVGCWDHCIKMQGGFPRIVKNAFYMLGADSSSSLGDEAAGRNTIQVGAVTNWLGQGGTGVTEFDGTEFPVPWYAGNNSYFYTRQQLTNAYVAGANVTAMERQSFHLKGAGQDYVVDHVQGTLSSSATVRVYQHHVLHGCGTVTSSSCVTSDFSNNAVAFAQASPATKLNTKMIALSGSITSNTETSSATNGSYAANGTGQGYSWRWYSAYTGTTPNIITVYQPSTSTGTSQPTIVPGTAGSFTTLEIRDASNPKAIAFTSLGATASSLSGLTLNATSQLTVSGLAAGTYKIQEDGADVSGCTALVVVAGEQTLNCNSVPAGAITIAAASGGSSTPAILRGILRGKF